MKKNAPKNSSENNPNVKEISEGVYINLNRITSHKSEFEKAIEESFKDLKEDKIKKVKDSKAKNLKK